MGKFPDRDRMQINENPTKPYFDKMDHWLQTVLNHRESNYYLIIILDLLQTKIDRNDIYEGSPRSIVIDLL